MSCIKPIGLNITDRYNLFKIEHTLTSLIEHIFFYKRISAGYKMVGNAVPTLLAFHLASAIKQQLQTKVTFVDQQQLLLPV
ncbi:MAG: DNA cytosine methyltransferase [Cyanobacteria bacterium KgW148]|nr:DNA cytosine methyltransferase [Cyanobacteria bacterium KgW148]